MRTGRDMWLNALILNEFGADVRPEKSIVTPPDSRLMTICHAVLANPADNRTIDERSEEHTSELQSLTRISTAVFSLNKKSSTTQENTKINKQNKTAHLIT